MLRNAVSSNGPSDLDILIERERRRRRHEKQRRIEFVKSLSLSAFAERTKIKVPVGNETTIVPFRLWEAQANALATMEEHHLIIFLKARQLGISWLACLFSMHLCVTTPGQEVMYLSKGQLEANQLAERTRFLYWNHQDRESLPALITDNTQLLEWDNDSRAFSLPATRDAGRTFTASVVVLDEWAFMKWPMETLAAVKPTIDAGGKLFIISSADGNGTAYHQMWESAKLGANGYTPIFLPWFARPDRGHTWRDEKLIEAGGDTATIYREYPANDIEAFTNASDLVYDVWSDSDESGNVTERAEYLPDGGPVLWAVDDGYAGERDPKSGYFTAHSHPRVFLLCQQRADGTLCVFAEDYAVKKLSDQHIADVSALGYPPPDWAAVDKSAAELRGRLHTGGIYTRKGPADVEESIKELRRSLAKDANGVRRILVHPRCKHLRAEMVRYRRDPQTGKPIKEFDHGCDALRYLNFLFTV